MSDSVFADILAGLLSADGSQRRSAEEKLGFFRTTEQFGVVLAEVLIGVGYAKPVEQRQLAGTLLKQYVETHWSSSSEKFSPPQAAEEVKAKLRKFLPISLKDPQKSIRILGAYAVATIAKYDWPDQWPSLFDIVANALKTNNPDIVHGAMHLLSELVNTVSEQQLQGMEDLLLSELRNIFVNSEIFSIETRARAISIFATISSAVSGMTTGGISRALASTGYFVHLRLFTDAMWKVLLMPDDGLTSDITLKTEIIKALGLVVRKFPKQMQKLVPHALLYIGDMLEANSQIYTRCVVDGELDEDILIDSESLEQLIFALIEFIHSVMGKRLFSEQLVGAIHGLVCLAVTYVQIPEDKVDEWSKDVQRYVEDEDVEMCVTSVRMSAVDLIVNLCEHHPTDTVVGLWLAVTHHLGSSNVRKQSGDHNWWKIREACYTALSSVATHLMDIMKEKPDVFNIHEFMLNVLMPDVSTGGPIFLQGHALSFAGRIANAWGQSVMQPLLELCSTALLPQYHMVIRVCACRAFFNFCEEAKISGVSLATICDLKPVISSLVAMGIRSSEAVLNLVLSSLSTVIQVDPTAAIDSKVVPLLTAAMLKYSGDPLIPSQVAEIVRVLMSVPSCREQIERNMLLTVFSAIRCEDKSKLPIRLPAVALEILEAVIRGSPRPLTDNLIRNGFPITVQCLLTSDDSHILAAGRECIRAFISKAADQVISWNDGTNSGVSLIVKIICHLLSPSSPELSASMVGRLVFVLLKRANDAISPYLEEILRAVLCKMYNSELNSVHQSLIMVFAHLIHYQMEPVFLFLSSLTTPNGESALQYVIALWCEKQKAFFGSYDQKVSTLALCKIFLYAISSPNSTLREMTLVEGPRTKLSASNDNPQPQSIPLLVKILKLLIYELDSQLDNRFKATGTAGVKLDEESDDAGAAGDGLSHGRDDDVEHVLKEIVSGMQGDVDDDISDENDDPDVADDAISGLDLVVELTNFLMQLVQQPYYQELYQHLSEPERVVLKKVNIL